MDAFGRFATFLKAGKTLLTWGILMIDPGEFRRSPSGPTRRHPSAVTGCNQPTLSLSD